MAQQQQGPAPAHWIRRNHVTRVPRRHVFIDTEAWRTDDGTTETQTFRLGVGCFDKQERKSSTPSASKWANFSTPEDLWQWVDGCTTKGRTTVLWAHNLGYDLRTSKAFEILPAMGWELEFVRLDRGQAAAQWRRDGRPLRMTDSMSWFGAKLETVGKLLQLPKLDLPGNGASNEAWFARCRGDVEILRAAVMRALDWVESDDLGNWKPTGAGQGWAAFRHKWMTHQILHHGDEEVASVEREAAWTGRCEAWRHGDLGIGPWHEVDFTSAYAAIAHDVDVPVRLLGRTSASDARRCLDGADGLAALLRCEVATEVPTVPTRGPRGILWPVGTFTSWLWDVEAAEVRNHGGSVKITDAYLYRTAPALRTWATWVLDRLDDDAADFDPVLRLIVKGWSRSVVGRFGARWSDWETIGEAHGADVNLATMTDSRDDRIRRIMSIGGRASVEGDTHDAPDGAVHVMSYVMAVARCRLLAAMAVAGLDHIAYVDTDGLLVDGEGLSRLDAAQLPGLRRKASYGHVEVLGPRQLVLDGKVRASGVPPRALRGDDGRWEAQVWRSLAGSLSHGQLDRVTIHDRSWKLSGTDFRRAHLAGGATASLRFPLDT